MSGPAGNLSLTNDLPPRAVVIPRAREKNGSSRLPIEHWVSPFAQSGARGLIVVIAPSGGGKTTTLRHLRAVLPDSTSIRFFESDQVEAAICAAPSALVILAAETIDPEMKMLASFELCPWTLDDCIEYLAATHRNQLAAVLKRLSEDSSLPMLKGSPQLMTLVMDKLASDPCLSILELLRQFAVDLAPSQSVRDQFMLICCEHLDIENPDLWAEEYDNPEFTVDAARWFRHEAIQRVFVGEWVAEALSLRRISGCIRHMASKSVLAEIANAVAHRDTAIKTLEDLIDNDPNNTAVAMAASILLRVDPAWRPVSKWPLNLSGAILRSANWSGIDLESATLVGADLTDADLSGANLMRIDGRKMQMRNANLRGARLDGAKFLRACFASADLSHAVSERANFHEADLTDANLASANLSEAWLRGADMGNAILHGAKLCSACFDDVTVEKADFTNADLTLAKLNNVPMYQARWDYASFCKSRILKCDLEGLVIAGADFTEADLTGSLLTGTCIPHGKFVKAVLINTGLAEIDWGNADLRDADFTHASFHLGSSRSGLVGSTVPCEGSRTGFYTDEFNEQDFKSPEEIRKACLCGTDLRGAKVEGTDFYLVDLRGATYTGDQGHHFAHCGAILVSRVA